MGVIFIFEFKIEDTSKAFRNFFRSSGVNPFSVKRRILNGGVDQSLILTAILMKLKRTEMHHGLEQDNLL